MSIRADYGTWRSLINADLITQKAIYISEVFVDPFTGELFHSESRPSEGGRNAIVHTRTDKDAFGLEWNARSGVHEYGGAACLAYSGKLYFSDFVTRRIYLIDGTGAPKPITPDNNVLRYANFAVYPRQPGFLVAVQEDHTKPAPADVVNTLVAVNVSTQKVTTIIEGADFYSSPTFSPGGKYIAWIQWNHPDMPWEGSQLFMGEVQIIDDTIQVLNKRHIDGKAEFVSVNEPLWADDDALIYLVDTSGFYNPHKYSVKGGISQPILPSPVADDFSEPAWIFGMSRMALWDANTLIVSPLHLGFSTLALLDITSGTITPIENPYVSISFLRRLKDQTAVMVGIKDDKAPSLIQLEATGSGVSYKFTTLKETSTLASTISTDWFSKGKPYTLKDGRIHAIVSPPCNPDYHDFQTAKPPAIVHIHGGPTGHANPGLSWITQYFTSRGWTWVDVNYRGSAGYGREYRECLRGQWGVAEVADAADSIKELGDLGVIDPSRSVIRGGSAGGYTVLMTLCTPQVASVFAAGTSSYGISDLKLLAEDTHKFESHYLFKLIGGTPREVPDIYDARSPVKHADKIIVPLLILQGSDDRVVPPSQAEAIIEKIKARKGRVDYVLFEGEGHGWRRAENVKKALETERHFYEDVLGLETL